MDSKTLDTGSSPLTRGKPTDDVEALVSQRLIPAHAGKTLGDQDRWREHQAHPRSRGENVESGTLMELIPGSSPLTRGKRDPSFEGLGLRRLIPAHAGKTVGVVAALVDATAHPRSRGENESPRIKGQKLGGSSPLTRGKHRRRGPLPGLLGLIPAHAGKTRTASCARCQSAAHPRSRGENISPIRGIARSPGSSPLTRGKRRRFRGSP